MTNAPIILVPGFWLGAWAWDEVVELLRADGHEVTAVTLPGLESVDADRSSIALNDHVEAICDAIRAARSPVVVAVHSGAAIPGYAASDRVPELIANMVYVDTGPGTAPMDPDIQGDEYPMPSLEELTQNEPVQGLSQEQLETFRDRAVPEPAGAVRDAPELTNDARLDVPSTMIATGFTSQDYRAAAAEGQAWLAGLNQLRHVTYVDLPTSHWPMWSSPKELARIIGEIAEGRAPTA